MYTYVNEGDSTFVFNRWLILVLHFYFKIFNLLINIECIQLCNVACSGGAHL
jgi:hypothetical protein